eukprot:CAMPEP_0185714764 /NCGR_PEP_ID=MMETSP1164-20130828/39478_1 /TAXON_ID=1104430 /ORGANISM="Chrysoreinhardia sp, Strain CCMP2950" /LENGTH=265 /DNA_ID=CAMNT_0028382347 /DNA_START=39 /DNA_END=833 /DNA_ORIENTATION=-
MDAAIVGEARSEGGAFDIGRPRELGVAPQTRESPLQEVVDLVRREARRGGEPDPRPPVVESQQRVEVYRRHEDRRIVIQVLADEDAQRADARAEVGHAAERCFGVGEELGHQGRRLERVGLEECRVEDGIIHDADREALAVQPRARREVGDPRRRGERGDVVRRIRRPEAPRVDGDVIRVGVEEFGVVVRVELDRQRIRDAVVPEARPSGAEGIRAVVLHHEREAVGAARDAVRERAVEPVAPPRGVRGAEHEARVEALADVESS